VGFLDQLDALESFIRQVLTWVAARSIDMRGQA
jgi:hypothetical protein